MEDQEHPLKLYNSLTRKVERFKPQDPARVTMYNCGPTVYSYAHIGNARAAVVADVLFRVLRHIYGEGAVVYARNLTDVDDKIIAAAREAGVPISDITDKFAKIYQDDLAALNCLSPTHEPRATEHIQGMADLIVTLLDKDAAYASEGHVYFDVTKDEDYGKLSGRRLEDNLAGARVEVAGAKRNAADFVLWKPAKDGEPGWSQQESSDAYCVDWGKYGNQPFAVQKGRPGWHIECSAMAKETLGETIDIHCGGIDLKFPHHENEIAQSETANGEEFARFWVHNEFLQMGKDKMSKSLGNVVLVHDLLKEWDGEVIRHALQGAHYRNELVWSRDRLQDSKNALDYFYRLLSSGFALHKISFEEFKDIEPSPLSFLEFEFANTNDGVSMTPAFSVAAASTNSFLHDLSTSALLNALGSTLFWIGDAEQFGNYSDDDVGLMFADVRSLSYFLGFLQRDPEEWFRGNASSEDTAAFDALARARGEARAAKDWAEADRIRDEGAELGIVFEDGRNGTSWRKA